MAAKEDVEKYLNELKVKISIYDIYFLDDRGKNQQALSDLEISPDDRKSIISKLTVKDYSDGPLPERMRGILPMWIFGKEIKAKEVYIKISMGAENDKAICISFHIAEFPMKYPFK
jgi:hypothetical protein